MSSSQITSLSDIGEFTDKKVAKILYPTSIEDVREIVLQAVVDKTPLYPISTGKNWGLGSAKPVINNSILVNLGRLNNIRSINLDMGYAIVETGVTQADLYNELKDTPYMLNVTRSVAETSVIANALERGLGSIHQKSKDLLALEVVTGTSELIRCGSFWSSQSEKMFYPHGIGPELTPLFMQSNFGIVTAGAVGLVKRPEITVAVEMNINNLYLPQFITALRPLIQEQCFFGMIRIFNDESNVEHGFTKEKIPAQYKLIGSIAGRQEIVDLRQSIIENTLANFLSDKILFTPLDSSNSNAEYASYLGIPNTPSVTSIFGLHNSTDIDTEGGKGFVAFIPILPFNANHLSRALDLVKISEKIYDMKLQLTINVISDNALYLSVFLFFNRDLQGASLAHKMFNELKVNFIELGYFPYRLDIDSHNEYYFNKLYGCDSYQGVLQKMKKVFDPHCIIAPNRYIKL